MGKLMIYGTTSSAGKSLITTGLCRLFSNKGYKVAPFKSQNMSRKYAVLENGDIISTAQLIQAKASRMEIDGRINPLLLVPRTDNGSDVYFNGSLVSHMKAKEYFEYKKDLREQVKETFISLEEEYDIVIIEGAGSPAEINLMDNDLVNTGMAKMADTNAILVVDIDRGGAFAALYGTVMILKEEDRKRIKGFVINKFRGDKELLQPGIKMIEEMTSIPVLGVMPYFRYQLPDEDSLVDANNVLDIQDLNDDIIESSLEKLAGDIERNFDIEKLMEIMQIW